MFEQVPIGDTFEHMVGEKCWCQPRWSDEDIEDDKYDGEPSVLIHNSHDGREAYESGLRLPH